MGDALYSQSSAQYLYPTLRGWKEEVIKFWTNYYLETVLSALMYHIFHGSHFHFSWIDYSLVTEAQMMLGNVASQFCPKCVTRAKY